MLGFGLLDRFRRRRHTVDGSAVAAARAAAEAGEGERRQRWLETAFLAGDVPPVWYRQQMAAIAAETPQDEPDP